MARLVYQALEARYGRDEVFMDIDAIPAGVDFVSEVERIIDSSAVVLALVGRHWAVSEDGRRRLDDPKDFVRQEITAALAAWKEQRIHLIPVIAPNSPVPQEGELPEELRGFERINAVKLSEEYWKASIQALVSSVEAALPRNTTPPPPLRKVARPRTRHAETREAPPARRPPSELAPQPEHFSLVAARLAQGRVSFVLGPGVNPREDHEVEWHPAAARFVPTSTELAAYLSREFHLEEYLDLAGAASSLATVTQYAEIMLGEAPLYQALRSAFAIDYEPTPTHHALARLPHLVGPRLLFVTFNYDDVLEGAFDAAGVEYDVVSYIAAGPDHGRFLHYPPHGNPVVIERGNEYADVRLEARPAILKLLGGIDRLDPERDSYVVSEEDQLEYASRADLSSGVPITLRAALRRNNLLFLGTSPRELLVRVALDRILAGGELVSSSWAVQITPDVLDRTEWKRRGVEPLAADLRQYLGRLAEIVSR